MPRVKEDAVAPAKMPTDHARKRQLAQIHIARKELGMDESTYRAVLLRVTGARSLTQLQHGALEKVVQEMRRLGWTPSGKRPIAAQPHVRKVYALWTSMAMLLGDSSQAALRSFVMRQTGVEQPEWLDPQQANAVIEGLKAWRGRLSGGGSHAAL